MGNPYPLNEARKPVSRVKLPMKSMVFITAFAVLIALMSGAVASPTTAIFENQYGRMTVYPEIAEGKEISKSFTQYLNLTSKMAIKRDIDFALVYGNPIIKSRIWLQQAYDNFMPKNASCSSFGCREYNASHCNCTSYKWVEQSLDINHYYNPTGDGNHYYILNNIPFSPGQSRYVKWAYQTKESNGKWELLMKPSSMGWLEANSSGYLFSIDPYWNASNTSVVQDTYISGRHIGGEEQRGFNFGSGDENSLQRTWIGRSYNTVEYRRIWGFFRANLTNIPSGSNLVSSNLTVYTVKYGFGECFNITLRRSLCQWDEGSGINSIGQASFYHANTSMTGWWNGKEFNDTGGDYESSCISPEIESEIYVCSNADAAFKTWNIRTTTIQNMILGIWPNYGFVTQMENFSAAATVYEVSVVSTESALSANYRPQFQFTWVNLTDLILYAYNASDNASIASWNVFLTNGTINLSYFNANNPLILNQTDNPTGTINMTIWKNGYGNSTWSIDNSDMSKTVTFARHLTANGALVNIISPANNTTPYLYENLTLNITMPFYAEGNGSIYYMLNNTGWVLGCAECREYSKNVSFSYGTNNISALINSTNYYPGLNNENKTINIIVHYSQYNITLFTEDEWNTPFDVSLPDNVTLFIYCIDGSQYSFGMSKWYYDNLTPVCTVSTMYIVVNYPTDSYTREITVTTNTTTFYLVDAYNKTLVQAPIYIDDYAYFNSKITFYKQSINQEYVITQGHFDVGHKFTAYLIKDHKYTLRITKGSEIREIGFFYATTGVQHISISSITLRPDISLISNHLRMAAQVNNVTNALVINYYDDLDQTNSVRVRVYEGVNQTAFFDTTYGGGTGNLTITILGINTSKRYSIKFTINHQSLGNSPIDFVIGAGIFGILVDLGVESWLYPTFAFAIIFFTSMVTIPKNRLAGILFLAVLMGIFFYIGWFNYSIGIAFLLMVFIAIAFIYELKRGDIV